VLLTVGGAVFVAAIIRKRKRSALNTPNTEQLYYMVKLPSVGQNGIYKLNNNVLGINQISEYN